MRFWATEPFHHGQLILLLRKKLLDIEHAIEIDKSPHGIGT